MKNFGYPNNTLIFDIVNGFCVIEFVKVSSISGYNRLHEIEQGMFMHTSTAMLELLIRGYAVMT